MLAKKHKNEKRKRPMMVEVVTVVLKWMVTVMFFSKIYRKLEIIEVISVRGADSFVI